MAHLKAVPGIAECEKDKRMFIFLPELKVKRRNFLAGRMIGGGRNRRGRGIEREDMGTRRWSCPRRQTNNSQQVPISQARRGG